MNSITPIFQTELQCPVCGSAKVRTEWRTVSFRYGDGSAATDLSAYIPMRLCGACKSEYMDEQAEELRHEAVCKHLRILSPREIVGVRERYGLTQEEFCQISRIGRASLTRWETGSIYQNGANDSLLFLLQHPENLDRLQRRFQEEMPGRIGRPRFRALGKEGEEIAKHEAMSFSLHEACDV